MSSTTDDQSVSVVNTNSVEPNLSEVKGKCSPPPPPPSPSSNNSLVEEKESKPQVNLLDVPVVDEHAALNVIVGFLGIAQRRGAFAINESAKIFECVKMFQPNKP